MLEFFKSLFGFTSLNSILARFEATLAELEAHVEAKAREVETHAEAILFHTGQREAADAEMARANAIHKPLSTGSKSSKKRRRSSAKTSKKFTKKRRAAASTAPRFAKP
jgi:hypothetical protein